ncbi:MAG: hypothetical protein NTZ83_05325, partial [Candidatus Pacearchaeota archaeon]|nr:hypothetical protein [Candidatus Pacearchaeota archaeon]
TDKIFYKWRNSNQIYFYSGEFGMEESPIFNEGGTTDLIYWGELSCEQNESTRKQLIKLDLSPPEIENIIPANNSLIQDSIPKIDAKIIDRIERDSGINPSSIVARIDGKIETNCNISESYTPQDFNIRCIPLQELSDGIHNVSIYAEDNSGRSSVFFWKFEVKKLNYDFVLKTYSPDKEIYPEKRVPFNLSVGKKINSIEYIDWNNLNPKFTKLCSNCKDYGFSNSKFIVFADGPHNITVRGTSGFVFEKKDFLFMVDTIAPRIYNTTPKSNQPASGLFYVKFEEKNVNKVSLIINKLHVYDVTNCIYDGKYNECTIEVDLSGFEGQKIEYSFNVSDYFRSTSSTAIKVKVNPSSG